MFLFGVEKTQFEPQGKFGKLEKRRGKSKLDLVFNLDVYYFLYANIMDTRM